jgi:small GTP-binding protein
MLQRVLTPDQESLLADERGVLVAVRDSLARAGAGRADLGSLDESVAQLDRLFLLVVVGEFNSGKSTFINALLGHELLEEGVTPTTSRIHRLGFGDDREHRAGDDGIEEVRAPLAILRQLEIVDTPGTNALERHHEALTKNFVPRSDLVVFVTSADRPLTESERAFIESIRQWGKKLVLVVNKIDFLGSDDDLHKIETFVRSNATRILDLEPEVFLVSSRLALQAKLAGGDPQLAARSRFFDLERFLTHTLDDAERLRLKLGNPLGVGRRLLEQHLASIDERLELLQDDLRALSDLDGRIAAYGDDMRGAFRFRLTDVDNELHRFSERGDQFFDDTVRLARALDLLNKERIQADYERKVIADTPQRLEQKVDDVIEWMIQAELEQWQQTVRLLDERRASEADGFAGALDAFDRGRRELLETVRRTARRGLAEFDQRTEARRLAESVRTAVAGTAILEAGAVGLGTVFTVLATSQAADVTGLLAAGTLAVLGLFVLPARRRRAKAELARKILRLRTELLDSLTATFDREIDRSIGRMKEAVSPYTRFVRSRREELTAVATELESLESRLSGLEARISDL